MLIKVWLCLFPAKHTHTVCKSLYSIYILYIQWKSKSTLHPFQIVIVFSLKPEEDRGLSRKTGLCYWSKWYAHLRNVCFNFYVIRDRHELPFLNLILCMSGWKLIQFKPQSNNHKNWLCVYLPFEATFWPGYNFSGRSSCTNAAVSGFDCWQWNMAFCQM